MDRPDMSVRPPVVKRVFARSGNRCAFPGCTMPLVGGETALGEICHIAAASAQGPRYDAAHTDEQRNGIGNPDPAADLESYTVARLL